MNIDFKYFLFAALAAGIGMWILAGIWHEIIALAFYTEENKTAHEGLGILFAAYLVLGLLMAYLYPLGYKGGKPVIEGFRFGLVIGLLWVFPHGLAMAGAHGESLSYVFKNSAWHMVEQGFGGIIIALVFSKMSNLEKSGGKRQV